MAEAFTEGSRGSCATGKGTWEESLDGRQPGIKGQQLAVLPGPGGGQDSRGLMSCCIVQRPLYMLVKEEKLALIHCQHCAKDHKREVLLPGSANLTCKATPQCVSSYWSSATWQI